MSAAPAPATDSAPTSAPQQEVGTKVFVGNLAFATKDADLKEAFSRFGELTNAVIINRGTRSLGYGFVTFVSEDDAKKSLELHQSDLVGRQINVELAKPPTPRAPRAPRESAAAPKETAQVAEGEEGAAAPAKARKPRAKRPKTRKPRADDETEEAGDAPVQDITSGLESTTLSDKPASSRQRRPRAPKSTSANNTTGTNGTGEQQQRERRGTPSGPPSQTLLFVANLPFSVDHDKLKSVFDGYKVKSARVVMKKMGPNERSKGFGFVELESHEEQQRALEKLNGTEVEGREIQLKVALDQEKKQAAEAAAASQDATDTGLASGEIIAS